MRTAILITALAFAVLGCGSSTSSPVAPNPTPPQWTLTGTVRGDGAVLSTASVTITKQPLPIPVAKTTTDGRGGYLFPAIDEGSYFVGAEAPGYVTVILPVTLTSARTVDFDLPLNPTR
jgi:hypothetical protein